MRRRFLYILTALTVTACGPANDSDENNDTTVNNGNGELAASGPFWELVETMYTPQVTGTSVVYADDRTITLGDSEPAGWTITFTLENGFTENTFYASDNMDGRVGGTLEGPGDTCEVPAGTDNPELVTLQTATLQDGVPMGGGTITAADCFGSPAQGAAWSVNFGVRE